MPTISKNFVPMKTVTPPTPLNESGSYDVSDMDLSPDGFKQSYGASTMNGDSHTDWKTIITNAIDDDQGALFEFLDAFNTAIKSNTESDVPTASKSTAPAARVISAYLTSRGIKSMSVGPTNTHPSLVSVFDEDDGPCLVLNGLLNPNPPPNLDIASCTAGTAAVVATYAYLHSLRANLVGTVVLEAISDDEGGAQGGCRHLLHTDERRTLWRGDCMLTSVSCDNTSGLDASAATHPVATALSNNGKRVMGRRPSIPILPGPNHCRFWSELGTPSFSFGVREDVSEGVRKRDWLELVKVLALTGWDYVGLDDA